MGRFGSESFRPNFNMVGYISMVDIIFFFFFFFLGGGGGDEGGV